MRRRREATDNPTQTDQNDLKGSLFVFAGQAYPRSKEEKLIRSATDANSRSTYMSCRALTNERSFWDGPLDSRCIDATPT
jgi:hypothetical protein